MADNDVFNRLAADSGSTGGAAGAGGSADARRAKHARVQKPSRRDVDQKLYARNARNEFERLFYEHQGRRIHKWHHFLEVYNRHIGMFLAARRARGETRPIRLLEIGVARGGSLQMWRKYLGREAVIFGVDINPGCLNVADADVQVRIGSQADEGFLRSVVGEMGGLDIIIDDGSHVASHQIASFSALFPRLAEDGLYICEDLLTAYKPNFEGGLNRQGTFIELTKQMIDWLHDWHISDADRQSSGYKDRFGFATGVFGIAIYDSIVVIEKRPKERPFHTSVGGSGRANAATDKP
jgi:hypothetical protein